MGASATPMDFGEVYTSLQSGVLDGYEHTASTTLSFKFHEIAKYMAITQHLIDPRSWRSPTANGRSSTPRSRPWSWRAPSRYRYRARDVLGREAGSLAQLKKLGMTITYPDMAEARTKAVDVQKDMAAKLKAEGLLQQILAQ